MACKWFYNYDSVDSFENQDFFHRAITLLFSLAFISKLSALIDCWLDFFHGLPAKHYELTDVFIGIFIFSLNVHGFKINFNQIKTRCDSIWFYLRL